MDEVRGLPHVRRMQPGHVGAVRPGEMDVRDVDARLQRSCIARLALARSGISQKDASPHGALLFVSRRKGTMNDLYAQGSAVIKSGPTTTRQKQPQEAPGRPERARVVGFLQHFARGGSGCAGCGSRARRQVGQPRVVVDAVGLLVGGEARLQRAQAGFVACAHPASGASAARPSAIASAASMPVSSALPMPSPVSSRCCPPPRPRPAARPRPARAVERAAQRRALQRAERLPAAISSRAGGCTRTKASNRSRRLASGAAPRRGRVVRRRC